MPHFLIKKEEIKKDYIELVDNDNLFHITKVLRTKAGQNIKFIDEDKNLYFCKIFEINKNGLKAEIIKKDKSTCFLKTKICLIQSILSQDAQNLAIANATQTGVQEIIPVISDNVSVKRENLKGKLEKWQKIALENFKQCERADSVKIHNITTLKEALKNFKKENTIIFAEKYANLILDEIVNKINTQEKIAVVIGPEGGFSQEEFEFFKKNNYNLTTLGKMIFKAPNAVVAGVTNIISRIEKNV